MSKKDRYSHLGGDADDEETTDEPEAETAVDEEETDEPTEEVEAEASGEVEAESSEEVETEAEPTEEVENDSPDETAGDSVDEPADELDDGAIRVTISDGDEEHEVVIDADEGVTTDDVVHAVQHAGQEAETRPKTMWGSWVRMATSLGKARLAAVTVASLLTVKGLTMVVRRFRRRD